MDLISAERADTEYTLEFERSNRDGTMHISISFFFDGDWMTKRKEGTESKGEVMGTYLIGSASYYPFEPKTNLVSLPVHIPDGDGRVMFKAAVSHVGVQTTLPIHATDIDHPGYPLMVVTFDKSIVTQKVVASLIDTIMTAIKEAEINLTVAEEETEAMEDPGVEEEADEDTIVEFELEKELKDVISDIDVSVVLPMEEDDDE